LKPFVVVTGCIVSPRQRHLQTEQLTPGITPADYQRQLMDGFQEGLQKVLNKG
jgi:flagellar assembly protein FliH